KLPIPDTDGDDKRDFQDVDSDNDGLSDLVEAGINPSNDGDNDGIIDGNVNRDGITTIITPVKKLLDTDSDNIPNFRDLDSDNDGFNDISEIDGSDGDSNGLVDTEDTLEDPTTLPDIDENDIPDVLEPNNPALPKTFDSDSNGVIDPIKAIDLDKDGIPDVVDGDKTIFGTAPLLDSDEDGIFDIYDIDDDNDGITDLVEEKGNPSRDTDGDGIVDRLDLDSDNDGILDIIEADGTDSDNDGKVDDASDYDNDGLADIADNNPNIADNPIDSNASQAITVLDSVDTDTDGKPDFQDIDSDNDGLSDLVEGGTDALFDADHNGMIDTNATNDENVTGDVDSDGIFDIVDENQNGTPASVPDTDNDDIPNYRDIDSDDDGLKDVIEIGAIDNDDNGEIDEVNSLVNGANLPDSNSNGVPDVLEVYVVVTPPVRSYYPAYIPTPMPTPTPEPEEVKKEPTIPTTVEENIEALDNIETVTPGEEVTIDLLDNDSGDIDVNSVELVIPPSFEPEAILSEDKKSLIVEGEGIWNLNNQGLLTFIPEENFDGVPTNILYRVKSSSGRNYQTATVALHATAIAGVTKEGEVCQTEDNVPAMGGISIVIILILSGLLGLFFRRKENKSNINI
ncbi:MAG: hypothetical protein KAU90_12580, partial [Sulfurovaceae bacterium]|nr:hypothetical protein [Sulfurovaceae bacterium]